MIGRRRFTRDRHGLYRTGLTEAERQLLKVVPEQIKGLLDSRDPSTKRVFPVAYPGDGEAEKEYREMMGEHLLARHQHAFDVLVATVDSPSVDDDEIHQWLDALEVLRLILGTQLDVSEDPLVFDEGDDRAPQFALYSYLSMLQGEIIDSLASALPARGSAPGDE